MPKRRFSSNEEPAVVTDPTKVCHPLSGVGKIKSVHCKDFVTYEECTFYPTEYLNVVIGPNGTGKSTLVAAIVLGLGGDPKVLSRASSIKDYIKNGKTAAKIVVEIIADNKGKCIQFHRNFSEACKSEYKINGDVVGKTNFLKKVAEFKIQINNLCQFLPQDRVQDFAKMNPQEILANTINSVCNENVIENFGKLKELRKHQQNGKKILETTLQNHRESLTRLEELKQILERYNKRKQILEKMDFCNSKKLWLEFDEIEKKIDEIKNDLNEAKKRLVQRKKAFDEIKKKQEEITKKRNELMEDAKRKINISKGIYEQKNKLCQEIEEAKNGIREAKNDFEKKKREWSDRQSDLSHEATMLAVIVEDLKIASSSVGKKSERESNQKSLQEELDQLKSDIKEHFKNLSHINKKLDEECTPEIQVLKKRLEHSKNVAEQKLQLLRNNFPDVHKAVLWLENNKHLFQGTVYTPMILELNVCDPKKSKYFENTIPLRDLLSFVCENKSDVSILVNELCIKQKIQINVAHSSSATECRYKPDEPITNLQKFGFTTYLIDLLDGPPAILNYLCYSFKLHNIPVGTEQVNRHTDSIPTHIRQYFGGDQRYNISVSKYSKERSLMQSNIKGKNLLLGCDMNIVQNLQQRLNELLKRSDILKNERTSTETKIDTLEYQCQEINNKRRAIESTVTRFNQLKDKCKRQEYKIRQLKENVVSISDMDNAFKRKSQLLLIRIIERNKQKVQTLQSYQKAIAKLKQAEAMVQLHKEQTEEITNAIENATDNLKQSQKVVDAVTIALDNTKQKRQIKVVQALKSTNNHKPSDVNFPYTEMFEELPNELEDLKEVLNDFVARLECLSDVDQEIVTEYERRCADIKALEKDILDNVQSEKNITAEISTIFTNWYPEISSIVNTLNEHFGTFMDSMSYVGEVILARKEDFDFESYGIQIMVQYRKNVPLQSLDRNVQSGGERAVAIAVYTLSLQHITHVPFRCVDEINQGMDARNERKIFEMLVNETTKTGRSQYFFVTPKLLPKLKDHERMTVHVVFNGKMVQEKNAFSFTI